MQELEKILEEIEIRAIKDLEEENDRCSTTYKRCCFDVKERKCNCRDAIIVRAFKKLAKCINGGWISVEEQLPEGRTRVICQFDNGDIELLWQDWESDPESLTYWTDFDFMAEKKVIAWRPLPEPYHPERCGGE